MAGEIIQEPQEETLTARCARLIPGYHGYEASLIISDAEPRGKGRPLVDVETAKRFAVGLATYVLSGNAPFGIVDPASPQGQELTAFISELTPATEQSPDEEYEEDEAEGMVTLLLDLHENSVKERAEMLCGLAYPDGQYTLEDDPTVADRSFRFVGLNEAAIEKEREESGIDSGELIQEGIVLYAKLMVAQRTNVDIILQDKTGSAQRIYLTSDEEVRKAGGEHKFNAEHTKARPEPEPEMASSDSLLLVYLSAYQKDIKSRATDLVQAVSQVEGSGRVAYRKDVKMSAVAEASLDIEKEESGMTGTDIANRAAATYCLFAHLQRAGVDIMFVDPEGATELLGPIYGPTDEL